MPCGPIYKHWKSNAVSEFSAYAAGKLLLTGEYAVMDGALALALPLRVGQSLSLSAGFGSNELSWTSLDVEGSPWFRANFRLPDLQVTYTSDPSAAKRLRQLFVAIRKQRAGFLLETEQSWQVQTKLDFPREWGLGSSSTLVSLLAQWAGVDPYPLQFEVFGGSGYDIACATASGPIFYQKKQPFPQVTPAHFTPSFADQLFFIFLNRKQNSRKGIRRYRDRTAPDNSQLQRISEISSAVAATREREEMEALLLEHEALIAELIGLPPVQQQFPDFPGQLKSLGAWGGDFMLALSPLPEEAVRAYFEKRGLETVFSYRVLVG